MSNILSFDIGGTYIKFGIINNKGIILISNKVPTPRITAFQGRDLLNLIISISDRYISEFNCVAVGISCHGVIDHVYGEVKVSSYHLPTLAGLPIVSTIEDRFKIPVYIDNDAKAAAIGEYWAGSAKNYKNFIFIALGTSIGGAIIIDGKIYRGVGNVAGEIGFLVTNESDNSNNFIPGAWECYGSASSLVKRYKKIKGIDVNANDFNDALNNKEWEAEEVLREYISSLATGIISLAHILSPQAFILGGGITSMGAKLIDPLVLEFKKRSLASVHDIQFKMATLGNDAGIIGAAYIARQKLTELV